MSKYDDERLHGKKLNIKIRADRVKLFKLDHKYNFKGFIEAGENKHGVCDIIMIVEHTETFILTFLKIAKVSSHQGVDI